MKRVTLFVLYMVLAVQMTACQGNAMKYIYE